MKQIRLHWVNVYLESLVLFCAKWMLTWEDRRHSANVNWCVLFLFQLAKRESRVMLYLCCVLRCVEQSVWAELWSPSGWLMTEVSGCCHSVVLWGKKIRCKCYFSHITYRWFHPQSLIQILIVIPTLLLQNWYLGIWSKMLLCLIFLLFCFAQLSLFWCCWGLEEGWASDIVFANPTYSAFNKSWRKTNCDAHVSWGSPIKTLLEGYYQAWLSVVLY